ncbi:hypothetical protein PSAC2689_50293 [Paraburkholderia sacchari]|uniref:hypothetical protein n=1 Tax=Paraburkholderia sacchari TaxID=159450 RepID=UPI0039A5A6A0
MLSVALSRRTNAPDGTFAGLANRRALDERLQAEWNRASRERTPLSVLLPGTALEGARKIADKIRQRIETADLAHRGSRYGCAGGAA